MQIVILLICIMLVSYSTWCLIKAKQIKLQKNAQQQAYDQKIRLLQNDISNLTAEKLQILSDIDDRKELAAQEYEHQKQQINEQIALFKDNSSYASEQYVACLEKEYLKAEQEYDSKIQQINEEKANAEIALKNLQDDLSAGVQAQLREREKEEKIDFYRIVISNNDITDIKMLNQFKLTFHNPIIINKLIWSNYLQKKVVEMCNRILGTTPKCGIYKITNLKTKQCYIGQSVNIAERWKQHCKCGCDIDASASNKLYQDMIKTGIWNFSFELMEECPRAQLNEKEAFWIKMYQSDIYGLNSTRGNK